MCRTGNTTFSNMLQHDTNSQSFEGHTLLKNNSY